jgi:DNA-directed RNA polymerase specialized sigma54-like protein
VDLYPNRENPFRETNTHSLQVLLKETKDLRQKLNERNSTITSLEQELKKAQTTFNTEPFDEQSPVRQGDH